MHVTGEAIQSDFRSTHTQTDREPSLAECVGKAVHRYLADCGEHEPNDFYRLVISEIEKPLLKETLDWTNGNQSRCAAILGLSRGTLRKKLKEHGII